MPNNTTPSKDNFNIGNFLKVVEDYFQTGNNPEIFEANLLGLESYVKRAKKDNIVGDIFFYLGNMFYKKKEYARAEIYYEKSLNIYSPDSSQHIQAIMSMLKVFSKYNDEDIEAKTTIIFNLYKTAQVHFSNIFEQPTENEYELFDLIGDLLFKMKKYDTSSEFYFIFLPIISKNMTDKVYIFRMNSKIARNMIYYDDVDGAITFLLSIQECLPDFLNENNISVITEIFVDLATKLNKLKKHNEAVICLKNLLIYYEPIDHISKGEINGLLGDIFTVVKDYTNAAKHHKASLDIYSKLLSPKHFLVCRACNRLNFIFFKFGLLEQSYVFFQKMIVTGSKLFPKDDKVLQGRNALALIDLTLDQTRNDADLDFEKCL